VTLDTRRHSASLAKGLAILDLFTDDRERTVQEISQSLLLPMSTTHRYLTTLVAVGKLEHTPRRTYKKKEIDQ
jgi:DNA-binding IclR family transcriptional regulator